MTNQISQQKLERYVQLADHLALDLLNTQAGKGNNALEHWNSSEDVIAWCDRNGISPERDDSLDDGEAFVLAARNLRAITRELVEQRKRGEYGNPSRLNAYLHANCSAPHIESDGEGKLQLVRIASDNAAAQMLGALAESAAQLLCEGDFTLVKQCEHPDCVLWFYDRTKAHRRRWCSMALCGNRFKAAQFRKKAVAVLAT